MKRYGFILSLLVLAACKKVEPSYSLSGGRILVVGHGGNGIPGINGNLPLDSKEGVEKALAFYNADGVELDVQLSADSVLFMYHDQELTSMTNCDGCSFDHSAAQLEQCGFKPVGTDIIGNCKLTRLEAILANYTMPEPTIFLDLHVDLGCNISDAKKQWYYTTTLFAINELLKKYNAYDHVFVQANSLDWTKEARVRFPKIRVFLDLDIEAGHINTAAANGYYGIASKNDQITKEEVALAHSKGLFVQVYGARGTDALKDAISKSPDVILADNIPLLQNILNY